MHIRKQINKQSMASLCSARRAACFANPEGITSHVIVLAFRLDVTPVKGLFQGLSEAMLRFPSHFHEDWHTVGRGNIEEMGQVVRPSPPNRPPSAGAVGCMKNIILSSPPKREIILEQEPLALNINVCLCFGLSSLLKMKGRRGEVKKFPHDWLHPWVRRVHTWQPR